MGKTRGAGEGADAGLGWGRERERSIRRWGVRWRVGSGRRVVCDMVLGRGGSVLDGVWNGNERGDGAVGGGGDIGWFVGCWLGRDDGEDGIKGLLLRGGIHCWNCRCKGTWWVAGGLLVNAFGTHTWQTWRRERNKPAVW